MIKLTYNERFPSKISLDLTVTIMIDFLLREGKLKPFVYNCFLYKECGYNDYDSLDGKQLKHIPSKEEIIEELKEKIISTKTKHFCNRTSFPIRDIWGYYSGSFNWSKTKEGTDYWSKTNIKFKNSVFHMEVEIPKKS